MKEILSGRSQTQYRSALSEFRQPYCPARVVVLFCFDDFSSPRTPLASHSIIFVGGFGHPPDVDAAVWLVQEILPLVRSGYVNPAELAGLYGRARVAVVPLRFGAGVKLKAVEAIHAGVPLVTTPVGAQGLEGLDNAASVADGAQALAKKLVRLLRDDASWVDQSRRQLDYAKIRFSREASVAALKAAIDTASQALCAHMGVAELSAAARCHSGFEEDRRISTSIVLCYGRVASTANPSPGKVHHRNHGSTIRILSSPIPRPRVSPLSPSSAGDAGLEIRKVMFTSPFDRTAFGSIRRRHNFSVIR